MVTESRILGVRPYFVLARVSGTEYLVKVNASSIGGAEHVILDKGIVGACKAAVETCQAFDERSAKTDYFIGEALRAQTVSLQELGEIIAKRNAVIEAADELDRCEIEMEDLKARMEEVRQRREAALGVLEEAA